MGLDDFKHPIGSVDSKRDVSQVGVPKGAWNLMVIRFDTSELANATKQMSSDDRKAIVSWLDFFIQNHPYTDDDKIEQKARDFRSELIEQGLE